MELTDQQLLEYPIELLSVEEKKKRRLLQVRSANRKHRENNREAWNRRTREYRQQNLEKIRKYDCEQHKKKWQKIKSDQSRKDLEWKRRADYMRKWREDPQNRISQSLRKRISEVVRIRMAKKVDRTMVILGCTVSEFMAHLEKLWKPGMSWENYGKGHGNWVIDHIIPCASFDMLNEEDQRKCFHYTNMQPLWFIDNCIKKDRICLPGTSIPVSD